MIERPSERPERLTERTAHRTLVIMSRETRFEGTPPSSPLASPSSSALSSPLADAPSITSTSSSSSLSSLISSFTTPTCANAALPVTTLLSTPFGTPPVRGLVFSSSPPPMVTTSRAVKAAAPSAILFSSTSLKWLPNSSRVGKLSLYGSRKVVFALLLAPPSPACVSAVEAAVVKAPPGGTPPRGVASTPGLAGLAAIESDRLTARSGTPTTAAPGAAAEEEAPPCSTSIGTPSATAASSTITSSSSAAAAFFAASAAASASAFILCS